MRFSASFHQIKSNHILLCVQTVAILVSRIDTWRIFKLTVTWRFMHQSERWTLFIVSIDTVQQADVPRWQSTVRLALNTFDGGNRFVVLWQPVHLIFKPTSKTIFTFYQKEQIGERSCEFDATRGVRHWNIWDIVAGAELLTTFWHF